MPPTPLRKVKPIIEEVATIEKDIDLFNGWTTRLENPDQVLRLESQGKGVKLYEEMQRDWQVYSMLQTRSLALQACEWQVEPATDKRADKKIADFVEEVLKDANFDRLTGDLMEAVVTGYKPTEIMWDASEGEIWINDFRGRRPSRFIFDPKANLRLLTLQNMYDGEPVPDRKFITWTFGGGEYNPYGRGLGYQLYWPTWFKKQGVKFWVVFAEKFGSPTAVGKYPVGTGADEKSTLLEALDAIQQKTGIRIPETMTIELLEAKRAGDATYEQLCEYMDRAIAKVLVGQTLTSEAGDKGSGSYALGKVHDDVRRDILKSDADSMCETINNTVVKWLVDFNFPVENRHTYPKVWRRTEPEEDLQALAQRDKLIMVDMGFAHRVPETYIEDTYGIPLAKPEEATIGAPPPLPGDAQLPGAPPIPQAGKPAPKVGAGTPPPAPSQFADPMQQGFMLGQPNVDRIGDRAISAGADEIQRLLEPVLNYIRDAESLQEIGERLYEFYPQLDSERFQELLARAMFAAGLTGYSAASGNNA
jgi:phage gp29-like protein